MKGPRNYRVSSHGPGGNFDNGSGSALGGRITSVLNVTLQGQTCPPCATWRGLESLDLGNKTPLSIPWDAGPCGGAEDSRRVVRRVQGEGLLSRVRAENLGFLPPKFTEVGHEHWRSPSVTPPITLPSWNTSEFPEEGIGA